MKALRILVRNIRDAFRSIWRNFALSLASITAITVTLIVVAFSLILTYNVNYTAEIMASNIEIIVFLEKEIDEETIAEVENEINSLDNVESFIFKSRLEIAEEYMSESDVFAAIMESWEEDEIPLQDTFIVKVNDNEKIGDTANEINELEKVDSVNYGRGMVEQLFGIFDIIQSGSLIAVGALILVTGFLISNTIKITIFSRRKEIEIMRLVGASNLNIKIPFMFEGLFLGIIGAVIPVALTFYGYHRLYEYDLSLIMPILTLIEPTPFVYQVAGILLIIGVAVGMVGSWRAVSKHLKI